MSLESRWQKLWKRFLVPIDWEAVAVERWVTRGSRFTRKGDKRPLEDVAKAQAGIVRRRRRLQKEAAERAEERRRARAAARGVRAPGETRAAIMGAIEAGASTLPEIRAATGLGYSSVKGVTYQEERKKGTVERFERPEWRGGYGKLGDCRFGYRLTMRGRAELAWLRREMGSAGDISGCVEGAAAKQKESPAS